MHPLNHVIISHDGKTLCHCMPPGQGERAFILRWIGQNGLLGADARRVTAPSVGASARLNFILDIIYILRNRHTRSRP